MHYLIKNEAGEMIDLVDELTEDQRKANTYEYRHDWKTLERAQEVAEFAAKHTGKPFHVIDRSTSVWPRFDIYILPQLGDDVSYAFNGDYYPAGKITKISKTMRKIETDEGVVFYGDKLSGRWYRKGGTFVMVKGTISRQNPSF